MIFDTDVLIWVQRGNARAANAVNAAPVRMISLMTGLELLQNAKDKRQMLATQKFLSDFGFQTIPLTANIGHRALACIESFGLSHGLNAGDALIAATALETGIPLLSANHKHFSPIKNLQLVRFRP